MGFSAGGYMAAAAGTLFDEGDADADDPIRRASCRPDFIAPIYPLISLELQVGRSAGLLKRMLGRDVNGRMTTEYSLDKRVTSQTPPTFLVHAHDDGLSVEHSIRFYIAFATSRSPRRATRLFEGRARFRHAPTRPAGFRLARKMARLDEGRRISIAVGSPVTIQSRSRLCERYAMRYSIGFLILQLLVMRGQGLAKPVRIGLEAIVPESPRSHYSRYVNWRPADGADGPSESSADELALLAGLAQ